MSIALQLQNLRKELPANVKLVAVSKFHSSEMILEAYRAGQRLFGESKVQEIVAKYDILPKDICWHFIGHLQTNKVKYIVPFVDTIQSIDSYKIFEETNKQARKFNRVIKVLLQVHIAKEEAKFGFTYEECLDFINQQEVKNCENVQICGLMGMATYTDDEKQIRGEFSGLVKFFNKFKEEYFFNVDYFKELSIGMSDDYAIAIEEGSTMVRIGSKIFGVRE